MNHNIYIKGSQKESYSNLGCGTLMIVVIEALEADNFRGTIGHFLNII